MILMETFGDWIRLINWSRCSHYSQNEQNRPLYSTGRVRSNCILKQYNSICWRFCCHCFPYDVNTNSLMFLLRLEWDASKGRAGYSWQQSETLVSSKTWADLKAPNTIDQTLRTMFMNNSFLDSNLVFTQKNNLLNKKSK